MILVFRKGYAFSIRAYTFKKKCFKLNLLALEGIGVLIFLSGIPVYVIMKKGSTSPAVKNFSGNETYT